MQCWVRRNIVFEVLLLLCEDCTKRRLYTDCLLQRIARQLFPFEWMQNIDSIKTQALYRCAYSVCVISYIRLLQTWNQQTFHIGQSTLNYRISY